VSSNSNFFIGGQNRILEKSWSVEFANQRPYYTGARIIFFTIVLAVPVVMVVDRFFFGVFF
jgi:hypothetical protein